MHVGRLQVSHMICSMQDTLAVHVPNEVLAPNAVAERFTLEFWRGTMHVGECSLPIRRLRESKEEQVRTKFWPLPAALSGASLCWKVHAWCLIGACLVLLCRSWLWWPGPKRSHRPTCGLICLCDMPQHRVHAHDTLCPWQYLLTAYRTATIHGHGVGVRVEAIVGDLAGKTFASESSSDGVSV